MRRMQILISQQVNVEPSYGERRDTLDQAWYGTLLDLFGEVRLIPIPNNERLAAALLDGAAVDLIVLTGGNDLAHLPGASRPAPERDVVERQLLEIATGRRLPLLAVCRGFQHMNVVLGGGLSPCEGHVAVEHMLTSDGDEPPIRVNSFHNFGIRSSDLSKELRPGYVDEDNWVEAAAHHELPWLGIMWHPERSNSDSAEQAGFIRRFFAA